MRPLPALSVLFGALAAVEWASAEDMEPKGRLGGDTLVEFSALKTRLTAAYGTHALWLGAELKPVAELDHLGGFVGPRLHAGPFDLSSGLLGAYGIRRSFLPIQDTYSRDDAERLLDGEHALYLGVSTTLAWRAEWFGGTLVGESEAVGVFAVPEERRVFIEHLNAIDGDSWVFRQRLDYSTPLAVFPAFEVGAAVEGLWLNARKRGVLRAGPLAKLGITEELGLRFELLPAILSPDTLGLAGGRFVFGLWYRFLP
jgi:hypothetical protein